MKIGVIFTEAAVFCILFTIMVFAVNKKDTAAKIHNYPPDIQEEYFKTHKRVDVTYSNSKVVFAKLFGIIMFTLILALLEYIAGARSFLQGFLFSFGLMVVIGLYDTLFLDWVLFANMKIFRLPGTEHMDKEYHQKWFHLKGMLFPGLVFALIPSLLVGWILSIIK